MTNYKSLKADISLPVEAVEVFNTFLNSGWQIFLVGGAVRAFLCNETPHDFDFVTNASEEVIASLFKNTRQIGKAFGVMQVIINKMSFEVARFRAEGRYVEGRKPEVVEFKNDVVEDLKRRDFTCNALIYDFQKKEIIDYFDGIKDISNKVIRAIGKPEDRFVKEDCLRMLRAVRFATQTGFRIDGLTLRTIKNNASHIQRISVERITEELNKIFLANDPYRGIRLLYETNLLSVIMPELYISKFFKQFSKFHKYNLFEHTIRTLSFLNRDFFCLTSNERLIVVLTLLFHDLGKMTVCEVDGDVCRYKEHPKKSREIALLFLQKMKYSNAVIFDVLKLIEMHDYNIPETQKSCKKLLNRLGERLLPLWKVIVFCDSGARGYELSHKKSCEMLKEFDRIICEVVNNNQCYEPSQLAINGNDLIALGIIDGKQIGKILLDLFNAVLLEEVDNEKNKLIEYVLSALR